MTASNTIVWPLWAAFFGRASVCLDARFRDDPLWLPHGGQEPAPTGNRRFNTHIPRMVTPLGVHVASADGPGGRAVSFCAASDPHHQKASGHRDVRGVVGDHVLADLDVRVVAHSRPFSDELAAFAAAPSKQSASPTRPREGNWERFKRTQTAPTPPGKRRSPAADATSPGATSAPMICLARRRRTQRRQKPEETRRQTGELSNPSSMRRSGCWPNLRFADRSRDGRSGG